MLGRLFLIGGLTYIVGSTCRLLVAKPLLLLVPILPILLLGAIFDWSHYEDVVRIALILFLWFFAFGVAALFLSGQVVIGSIACVPLLLLIFGVHNFSQYVDSRWDTPERRFADSLSNACEAAELALINVSQGFHYEYSSEDGYCHIQIDNDAMAHIEYDQNGKAVDVDVDAQAHSLTIVPPSPTIDGPVPGALENIQRLKAAMPPPVVAEPAGPPGFVSRVIDHMHDGYGLVSLLVCLVVGFLKVLWDAFKGKPAAAPVTATHEASQLALILPEPDPHAWLAEGRKAAGLS